MYILRWAKEFLTNRSQPVLIDDQNSNSLPVTSDNPPGFVLGPLLIWIYVNDLPLHVPCHIDIFADDCVVYHTATNVHDQTAIQDDVNPVQKWCERWLVLLNPDKCQLMSLYRQCNPHLSLYVITNVFVESVHLYKFLSVTLCNNLSWCTHITNAISSA